jgi:hypothetical protein
MKAKILLNKLGLKILGKCLVFDDQDWMQKGDVGDNSQYWKEATILNVRKANCGRAVVDVQFDYGRKSNGHFLRGVEKIIN